MQSFIAASLQAPSQGEGACVESLHAAGGQREEGLPKGKVPVKEGGQDLSSQIAEGLQTFRRSEEQERQLRELFASTKTVTSKENLLASLRCEHAILYLCHPFSVSALHNLFRYKLLLEVARNQEITKVSQRLFTASTTHAFMV